MTRVRKKSFLIMTILGPLLIAGFYALIGWAAIGSVEQKKVEVVDESGQFVNKFKNSDELTYSYISRSISEAKRDFPKSGFDVLAHIPANVMTNPKGVQLFAEKGVSLDLKSNIERAIEREIETIKLGQAGITQQVLQDAKVNVDSETISLSEAGEKQSSAGAAAVIGGICAFMIYISVFIYGTQVMRGVMEEKSNRIVEVIISSVKPYQLMMGKIIGVGLVGLTQFMLWIILTIALTSVGTRILGERFAKGREVTQAGRPSFQANTGNQAAPNATVIQKANDDNPITNVMTALNSLNIPLIVACFLFYFLGGYLLYSALFGAVGAAVDNETEVQQFMLPITLPIIFAIAMSQFVIRDPNGALAFWLSIFPFTSPVIMLVRIPMGVPVWELALSMVLLVLGFVGTIWLAARIYRVGILMYGKKTTYKELSKWIFYKA